MKDITLAIIDTVNPDFASKILDYNYNIFNAKSAKIFTNLNKLTHLNHEAVHVDLNNIADYKTFCINKLHSYIDTDYVLVLQTDGIIINPHLWSDSFLDWDYIGAPWPFWGPGPFLPHMNRVGNGGFSLRSKKFLDLTSHFNNISNENEDHFLCRTSYHAVVGSGLRFADLKTACSFALEHNNPEYEQTYLNVFGIHGKMHAGHLNQIYSKI